MREFEHTIEKAFNNGLRPEESNPSGGEFLTELRNARPSKLGLMPYQPTTLPYDADQAYHITDHVVIWPFPQNFFFKNHHLVGTKERMYMVDALGKLTSLFSYDSTERWDIADFSDYMAITKDGSKMMSRSTGGAYNTDTSIPLCETLINLNGQLFVGNLKPWSSWSDVDGRFVGWSDIGSAVFSLDNQTT
jgi:hypothetical protein